MGLGALLNVAQHLLAVFGVALVGVILVRKESRENCSDNGHCHCPAEWTSAYCYDSACYGARPDPRCQGQPDGHQLGDGTWCWNNYHVRNCFLKKTPLGYLADWLRKAEVAVFGPYVKVLPTLLEMWLFRSNRQVQLKGCQMISGYGWNDPASKEPLLRMGAVDIPVNSLKAHPEDQDVQSQCLNALAAISLYNRAVSLRAGELGVVEMTAAAWRKWFHDVNFMPANFFGCYQDYAPENRERMRKAGAIRLALEACGEGGIHYWSPQAQFSVWCEFSSFHSVENHAEFVHLGGLRSAHAAFRDHAKSYRVREEILQALLGLCATRAYREELAQVGFVKLLTQALKEDKNDPQVQALGLETLRTFVESNATLRSEVITDDGIAVAVAALQTHAGALLDTRRDWDKQNVYGDYNHEQYNVPGGAAELLYSLALDGPETHRAMLQANITDTIMAAIQATQTRIAAVRLRTWRGGCATLELLRAEAAAAGSEDLVRAAVTRSACYAAGTPPVFTNLGTFEP